MVERKEKYNGIEAKGLPAPKSGGGYCKTKLLPPGSGFALWGTNPEAGDEDQNV